MVFCEGKKETANSSLLNCAEIEEAAREHQQSRERKEAARLLRLKHEARVQEHVKRCQRQKHLQDRRREKEARGD